MGEAVTVQIWQHAWAAVMETVLRSEVTVLQCLLRLSCLRTSPAQGQLANLPAEEVYNPCIHACMALQSTQACAAMSFDQLQLRHAPAKPAMYFFFTMY